MTILGNSYKGKIVLDETGKPTGVAEVVSATVLDGAISGITGLLDGGETFTVGAAKTVGELTKIAIAVAGTSKLVSGSFIPRRPQ